MNDNAYRLLRFYTLLLLFIVLAFLVLFQARLLLIPISFGLLISFILYPICKSLEKKVGIALAITACEVILVAFGFLLFQLLSNSISLLQHELTQSQGKIFGLTGTLIQYVGNALAMDNEQQQALMTQLDDMVLKELFPFLKQTILFSAGTVTMMMIIPIFVALILVHRKLLVKFALSMVPPEHVEGFNDSLLQIAGTYFKFAKGMAMVYLVVATLNSLGFLAIGLPNAVYFGVLASLLTFFPYVGIFIGGMAAVIVAWTTFDSIWYPMAVVAILGFVQYLEGYVIFPYLVGRQLSINPLATLIAIILGGIVWGGAGMILFVPFTAILRILADHFHSLKPLAVLLGPNT